jgi:peroxiredoxin
MALYNTIIDFELVEIVAELELPLRMVKPLKPLKAGDGLYDFNLQKENINKQRFVKSAAVNSSVLFKQLAGKPLILFFYSAAWQERGVQYLKQLNSINCEVAKLGANLLVVSPDEGGQMLEQTIWDNSLYLNFYSDPANEIARKFGVYSDDDPAWDKYPGIDINVPLLSVYALNADNQIIFSHIDRDLEGPVPSIEILDALHAEASLSQKRKSA